MKTYAAVDIGSNTLRLLISRVDGTIRPLLKKRRITRLGKGLNTTGLMTSEAIQNSIACLQEFAHDMREYGVGSYRATATAAVRTASNREELLACARNEAGIAVEVIAGEEEARLTLLGVQDAVKTGFEKCLVFDVGGGSTEFALRCKKQTPLVRSVDLGAVNLTEQFLKDQDPPVPLILDRMREHIRSVVEEIASAINSGKILPDILIGTAGTVTTLAAMLQKLEFYDPDLINNYLIDGERLAELTTLISTLSLKRRAQLPGLEAGRADIICAGAFIVLEIMNIFHFSQMTVSDGGLLEGIIYELAALTTS